MEFRGDAGMCIGRGDWREKEDQDRGDGEEQNGDGRICTGRVWMVRDR